MTDTTERTLDFDATKDYRRLVPDGTYMCAITEADIKPTKAGDDAIVLAFQILEGEYKGCECKTYINYWSQNVQHRSYAHQALAEISRAAGINVLRNHTELLNAVMLVDWGSTKSGDAKYNKVTKFRSLEDAPRAAVVAGKDETW